MAIALASSCSSPTLRHRPALDLDSDPAEEHSFSRYVAGRNARRIGKPVHVGGTRSHGKCNWPFASAAPVQRGAPGNPPRSISFSDVIQDGAPQLKASPLVLPATSTSPFKSRRPGARAGTGVRLRPIQGDASRSFSTTELTPSDSSAAAPDATLQGQLSQTNSRLIDNMQQQQDIWSARLIKKQMLAAELRSVRKKARANRLSSLPPLAKSSAGGTELPACLEYGFAMAPTEVVQAMSKQSSIKASPQLETPIWTNESYTDVPSDLITTQSSLAEQIGVSEFPGWRDSDPEIPEIGGSSLTSVPLAQHEEHEGETFAGTAQEKEEEAAEEEEEAAEQEEPQEGVDVDAVETLFPDPEPGPGLPLPPPPDTPGASGASASIGLPPGAGLDASLVPAQPYPQWKAVVNPVLLAGLLKARAKRSRASRSNRSTPKSLMSLSQTPADPADPPIVSPVAATPGHDNQRTARFASMIVFHSPRSDAPEDYEVAVSAPSSSSTSSPSSSLGSQAEALLRESAFNSVAQGSFVYAEDLSSALSQCDFEYPDESWIQQILSEEFKSQDRLDVEEFYRFVSAYEHFEGIADTFEDADSDGDGLLSMDEFVQELRRLGISALPGVAEALMSEATREEPALASMDFEQYRWFVDVVIRERHGFTSAEVDELWPVFARYAEKGSVSPSRLPHCLNWMGYAGAGRIVGDLLHQSNLTTAGGLPFGHFLAFVRVLREYDVSRCASVFRASAHRDQDKLAQASMPSLMEDLGYAPAEPKAVEESTRRCGVPPLQPLGFYDILATISDFRKHDWLSEDDAREIDEAIQRHASGGTGALVGTAIGTAVDWLGYPLSADRTEHLRAQLGIDMDGKINKMELMKVIRVLRVEQTQQLRSGVQGEK